MDHVERRVRERWWGNAVPPALRASPSARGRSRRRGNGRLAPEPEAVVAALKNLQ